MKGKLTTTYAVKYNLAYITIQGKTADNKVFCRLDIIGGVLIGSSPIGHDTGHETNY
ncbi:MAG: hypothetical protein JW837_04355 [Sedimentisphaerales bacterium]|nr:hypothetical protein [Sedimentisphaerales bacterium]